MIEFTRKYANDEETCCKFFFSSNKGMSGTEMSSALYVNYKTALLLCRKCRALMASSDSGRILDSRFYEADTGYIGSVSRTPGRTGIQNQSQICRERLDSKDTEVYLSVVTCF